MESLLSDMAEEKDEELEKIRQMKLQEGAWAMHNGGHVCQENLS